MYFLVRLTRLRPHHVGAAVHAIIFFSSEATNETPDGAPDEQKSEQQERETRTGEPGKAVAALDAGTHCCGAGPSAATTQEPPAGRCSLPVALSVVSLKLPGHAHATCLSAELPTDLQISRGGVGTNGRGPDT